VGVQLLLAALLTILLVPADATGGWLDAPPTQWNHAGAAIPAPPAPEPYNLGVCNRDLRGPAGPDEAQVAAAGWRLEGYWPTARAGDLALVTATAGYDGMCRPWGFQVFAFAGGRFAGTISPEPMNSREDGVLFGTPTLAADGRVTAQFTRYKPTDPLCCPTGGRTAVAYRLVNGVLAAQSVMPAPVQLPRTGGPSPWLAPSAGLLLLGAGYGSVRLRHSKCRPSLSRT
jgi:hypothetical protein